jgi:hypothetical protein
LRRRPECWAALGDGYDYLFADRSLVPYLGTVELEDVGEAPLQLLCVSRAKANLSADSAQASNLTDADRQRPKRDLVGRTRQTND